MASVSEPGGWSLRPVGGLHDQVIRTLHELGIAQNGNIGAADIAAEDQPGDRAVPFFQFEFNNGRAEHVTGVVKATADAGHDFEEFVIIALADVFNRLQCVALRIKRFKQVFALFPPQLIHVTHVTFLYLRRIHQQMHGQIVCGPRGEDRSMETMANERGQISRMIDVRV